MNALRFTALALSSRVATLVGIWALLISPAMAQVNGPGPSPANLFDVVLSLPGDEAAITGAADESIGGVPGQTTQLNVDDGGTIGFSFDANSGSEVNIAGGIVGNNLWANPDSEINISDGTIGNGVRAFSGAVLNISGGDFGPRGFGILRSVRAEAGSEVNISGGIFDFAFTALRDSVVNISGGNFAGESRVFQGSTANISGGTFSGFESVTGNLNLIGGEFRLNGVEFSGTTVTPDFGELFTCTLADGSTFAFRSDGLFFSPELALSEVALPAVDLSPIVIDVPVLNGLSGLRPGQTLTLETGGVLRDNFTVIDATLNVEDGFVGDQATVVDSVVNISGGTVGNDFDVESGSVVNISGGTVGNSINVHDGSAVNIFGSQFFIDGSPLNILLPGEPVTITDRNVTLTGLLADGEPFSFELNQFDELSQSDFFDPGATLTVTIGAPAPDTILGDVDQDGDVDFSDIPAFIAVLQAGTFLENADCNLDGVVTFADIPVFISILQAI